MSLFCTTTFRFFFDYVFFGKCAFLVVCVLKERCVCEKHDTVEYLTFFLSLYDFQVSYFFVSNFAFLKLTLYTTVCRSDGGTKKFILLATKID